MLESFGFWSGCYHMKLPKYGDKVQVKRPDNYGTSFYENGITLDVFVEVLVNGRKEMLLLKDIKQGWAKSKGGLT